MNLQKRIVFFSLAVAGFVLITGNVLAFRLLTKEDALKTVFGPGCQIVTETKNLTGDKLAKIKERLGGSLVYVQKGAKAPALAEKDKIDFHFAVKDGKKTRVAIIDEDPGKWGPVEFIIALNLDGSVKQVEVMSYEEKRGRPIARRSYLSQFERKTGKDPLEVGKDITGISGATISSRCSAFAVKKAIIMYEELYLK